MSRPRAIAIGCVATAVITLASCGGARHGESVRPAGEKTGALRGWVDLHAHPMSYLGFGGKAITGGVDVGLPLPADAHCKHWVTGETPDQVLGNDSATHGAWTPLHLCGDLLRWTLVSQWEAAQGGLTVKEPHPGSAAGPPSFDFWPSAPDMLHQKMWIDWIREAYDGGQRVMVALADHDDTTARSFSGPGDGPNDDKESAKLQTRVMKEFVARHPEFMEIATDSQKLREIVLKNKMAVVLGAEIDSIGNFDSDPEMMACEDLHDSCADYARGRVKAEIQSLYDDGIRYLFPIHVVDNVFGGTAVYTGIFNLANEFTYGTPWDLECALEDEGIVYDGGFGMKPGPEAALRAFVLLKMFRGFKIPPPPTCPTGKKGVHNRRGLTKLGEYAIHEIMRHGMLIDIDHMSEHAADRAMDLAEAVPGGYPLMFGHNALRGTQPTNPPFSASNGKSEMQHTARQFQRIARLHGMFGLGNASIDAHTWIANYSDAVKLVPDPGAVALGTDLDGMVDGSPPTGAEVPPYQGPSGERSWDYKDAGVAHYGMLRDFLLDARSVRTDTVNGASLIDDRLYQGAEYFAQTWARAEQLRTSIPVDPVAPPVSQGQPHAVQACQSSCCDACDVCAAKGLEGGTCAACKGCQSNCACPSRPAPASQPWTFVQPMDAATAKAACQSGQGASCAYAGRMFDEGAGAPFDEAQAATLYRRACDLGQVDGCHRLAVLLLDGSGVPADPKEAASLETRACEAGFRQGCMVLAEIYERGLTGPTDGATKVYERMCARGDQYGCRQVGK